MIGNQTTTTYDIGKGYRVDVVRKEVDGKPEEECWLYHEKCGIKAFLHGGAGIVNLEMLNTKDMADHIAWYDEEYNF